MSATMMVARGSRIFRRGEDGILRDDQGIAYEDSFPTIGGAEIMAKDYEHVAHSLPQWKPSDHPPGTPCPYPNVVPVKNAKGHFKPAFASRREVNEFEARHPEWRFGRGD